MSAIQTSNVEAGLPALDEARRLVIEEIKRAKPEGVSVLKVNLRAGPRNYGSSISTSNSAMLAKGLPLTSDLATSFR